jgi:nucleoside-diphosphate-sugar epimerase
MKVLVTGGSGFVGKNLLISIPADWEVVALYNSSQGFQRFLELRALGHVNAVRVDLTSEDEAENLRSAFPRFDLCVYLAANGDPALSITNPSFDLTRNTVSLVNLLQRVSFDKFIYFSSGAVYDRLKGPVSPLVEVSPRLPYAISKLASENYLRFFRDRGQIGEFTAVRFFGAYGPYEPERKLYSRLVTRFGIERDPRFTIRGDGKNFIDAMHITDAIRAVMLLQSATSWIETLDLYHGEPMTLTQLVEAAGGAFGLRPEITYEGHVPEYIEFFSNDLIMKRAHKFEPMVALHDGLINLYEHLISRGSVA